VQQVTDNEVDERKPAWSPDLVTRSGHPIWSPDLVTRSGHPIWSPDRRWISYQSSHYFSPTHSDIFSAKIVGTAAP
jgi:WD40 repeat protein